MSVHVETYLLGIGLTREPALISHIRSRATSNTSKSRQTMENRSLSMMQEPEIRCDIAAISLQQTLSLVVGIGRQWSHIHQSVFDNLLSSISTASELSLSKSRSSSESSLALTGSKAYPHGPGSSDMMSLGLTVCNLCIYTVTLAEVKLDAYIYSSYRGPVWL